MSKMSRRSKASIKGLITLNDLPVKEWDHSVIDSYDRKEFGHGWKDNDKDGQDERQEALIYWHRERGWKKLGLKEKPELIIRSDGKVVSGFWMCRFTGQYFELPSQLDIDHMVPLLHAWVSGANEWTPDKRSQYANGFGIKSRMRSWLVPVQASANRSKGARGPDKWLPSRERYHLHYAAAWIHAKRYWKMSVTSAEKSALTECLHKIEIETP